MYESPFDIVLTPLSTMYEEVKKDIDGQIIESVLKATQAVNVTVDKEELLRALRYDRGQYDKGYADAKAEIVHCKDCAKHNKQLGDFEILLPDGKTRWIWKDQACPLVGIRGKAQGHEFDYQFCAFGERTEATE